MGRIADRFAYSQKSDRERGRGHIWWLNANTNDRLNVVDLTPQNVVREAGADYVVAMAPIGYRLEVDGEQKWIDVDDRFVVYRTDTGAVFGTTKERYAAAQNQEAADVLEGIYADRSIDIEGAGTYGEGAVFWIQARDLEDLDIAGDAHQKYVSVVLGHDGIVPFKAFSTAVRMVCENTVNSGLASGTEGITFKHTGDIQGKIAAARQALQITRNEAARYKEWGDRISTERLAAEAVEAATNILFPPYGAAPANATPKQLSAYAASMTKRASRVAAFNEVVREEVDANGLNGWTLWNGVTGYADHFTKIHRNTDRADAAMFGSIRNFKAAGFDAINDIVGSQEFAIN